MESKLKHWAIAHKLYLMMFGLIAIFGYLDYKQLLTFRTLNSDTAWALYNQFAGPSFWILWVIMIAIPATVYYFFTKDKSESIGIFAAGLILLSTGLEDIFYFLFSGLKMDSCMAWFNELGAPVAWYSTKILHETCVSPTALISFTMIGIIASYLLFDYMRKEGW